jgi:hypothetical protein
MSMSLHPEGSVRPLDELLDTSIHADYAAEFERIRAATYTGRDRENLVTAVVGGDGLVERVRFGATIGTRSPRLVADAIVAAVDAAQHQARQAWHELAARMDAERSELVAATEQVRAEVAMLVQEAERVWADVRL